MLGNNSVKVIQEYVCFFKGVMMKHEDVVHKQHKVLENLCKIPKRILSLHGQKNMIEFVLHDLCHEYCFNLKKAAFFIDNPDFNCLKGIAGFSRDESDKLVECDPVWEYPEQFSSCMKGLTFNNKVRDIYQCSVQKKHINHEIIVRDIAQQLDVADPLFLSWPVKHGNHGLFVFEKADKADACVDSYFSHGIALLGFCPIF